MRKRLLAVSASGRFGGSEPAARRRRAGARSPAKEIYGFQEAIEMFAV